MALLGVADYVVLALMLALSLGIGIFFAVRGKNTREGYLLGNRQMGVVSVAVSMFVTLQSAVSLLGFPSEIYTYGTMVLYIFISYTLTYIAAVFTCLPLLYPLHITSIYEYLERRFDSRAVRMLGTSIGMLQTILYMAVALLSPALALQASAGLPLWSSIVIVGLVGTLYTSIGGIKTVVWTDVIQSLFMLAGSVLVIILGMAKVGSFSDVLEVNAREHRLQYDELSPDPRVRHTVWGVLIGGFFNWYVNLFNQSTMQRICSIKTKRGAGLAFLLNIPMILLYGVLLSISGLLLVAYYFTSRCDPYMAGSIDNRNQLMPFFVLDVLGQYPGLSGLYMSTLFSGALSSLSSGINALAANTVEDVLSRPLKKASERTVTIVAKLAVCFYGLLAIALAYLARSLQGPVTQMTQSAVGATGGPILGMFFLGAVFPWANKLGALSGGSSGIVVNVLISALSQVYGRSPQPLPAAPMDHCWSNSTSNNSTTSTAWKTSTISDHLITSEFDVHQLHYKGLEDRPFYPFDISYMWYGLLGFLVSLLVGVVVSLLTGRRNTESLDSSLLFPFARKLWGKKITNSYDLSTVDKQDNIIKS